MAIDTATWEELEAYSLIYGNGVRNSNDNIFEQARDASEKIIMLAERIKSSRASATMLTVSRIEGAIHTKRG